MTEQQIKDGFDRLEAALAPPLDAPERITRRVAVRQRRRRGTVAAGTTLAVLAVGGVVALGLSGSDGSGDTIAVDQPSGPTSTLVMTRPDGSTYAFPDVEVTCDPPPGDEAEADGPQRIWAVSPRKIADDRAVEPFVYFNGLVAKVQGDQTFTFPNDWAMGTAQMPLVLFIADTDGNEVASSAGGESGTVHVLEASCDPVPTLRLQVDMTLGSEVQEQPLDVAGSLG
ncbi:hypothetical protein [Nocardioides mangrovi]|uniref:Uncharacterized protein n=1 Tax=Nocardioides mangrovi TaxID=2874580 RepID=A0ABS7UEJ0_9ACTN|nr:hypothetical protein [Nocardioides mangrovi]MBZ5739116.1 hypothetical protein [Nocardioides mangrovi]